MSNKISIASDHHGLLMKNSILEFLNQQHQHFPPEESKNYIVSDLGTYDNQKVDYPDYGKLLALDLIEKNADYGILICSTGVGMSIVANRFSGIRAALCTNTLMAQKARMHNDANVLILGADIISLEEAHIILNIFLNTQFEGGRHLARIKKIG